MTLSNTCSPLRSTDLHNTSGAETTASFRKPLRSRLLGGYSILPSPYISDTSKKTGALFPPASRSAIRNVALDVTWHADVRQGLAGGEIEGVLGLSSLERRRCVSGQARPKGPTYPQRGVNCTTGVKRLLRLAAQLTGWSVTGGAACRGKDVWRRAPAKNKWSWHRALLVLEAISHLWLLSEEEKRVHNSELCLFNW